MAGELDSNLLSVSHSGIQEVQLLRGHCALDAWIIGREKADQWQQQQAGIELLRAIGLHKGVQLRVEALAAHLLMQSLAVRMPALGRAVARAASGLVVIDVPRLLAPSGECRVPSRRRRSRRQRRRSFLCVGCT